MMRQAIATIVNMADRPTPKIRIDILWISPVGINIAINKDITVMVAVNFDRAFIQGAIVLSSMAGWNSSVCVVLVSNYK